MHISKTKVNIEYNVRYTRVNKKSGRYKSVIDLSSLANAYILIFFLKRK